MPQGNQLDFKSTNGSVEKYAIIAQDFKFGYDEVLKIDIKIPTEERIMGLYNDIKSLKNGLKWHRPERYLSTKIKKVKITIEELEEIIL